MWISHRKEIRNVSFRISLRWLIHIINPVDKTQLSRYTSHRRSTTVSLETYPSIHSKDTDNHKCLMESKALYSDRECFQGT